MLVFTFQGTAATQSVMRCVLRRVLPASFIILFVIINIIISVFRSRCPPADAVHGAPRPQGWNRDLPQVPQDLLPPLVEPNELPKEQIALLKNLFEAFDPLKTGGLGRGNLDAMLRMLGVELNNSLAGPLIERFDTDGSSRMELQEFYRLTASTMNQQGVEALVESLYEVVPRYDTAEKGYLTVAEMRDVLKEWNDKFSEDELDAFIWTLDTDNSGTVEENEFAEALTGRRQVAR